jgi:hypothetical protein
MPRGRLRVLDEGRQREVCALISSGCSLLAAAQYVGCAPNTIRREANRNPEFGRRLREAQLQAQLSPLQAMRKAANSHWRAAAWMLERADPEHFDRRPSPAFRPRQARALQQDILAVLNAEIEDPDLLMRIRKQIRQLMDYSIEGVVGVQRTQRELRAIYREIDELQFGAKRPSQAARHLARCQPSTNAPESTTVLRAHENAEPRAHEKEARSFTPEN